MFLLKAVKIGCNISSAIFQNSKIRFSQLRRRGITRSQNANLFFEESYRFDLFWNLLIDNLLKRFNTAPVHSLSEIMLLKDRFPDNIKLYVTCLSEDVVAGCVIFEMKNTIHVQYITTSEKGKELGALDLVFDNLINKIYLSVPVFDFGHSTERMGEYLNENLIFQKEGFGGRGIVYETYKYSIA